jgi:hypothetical protein
MAVAGGLDEVCAAAVALAHGLDEVGATIEQPDAVVGRVAAGQGAVGDELLEQRAALLLGVVVHRIRVRHERESVGERPQVRTEGVGRAADMPADRSRADAGEHDARLPRGAHRLVHAVQAPHREQPGDAAAEHPDDVLIEQMCGDVLDVRHREREQVRRTQAAHHRRLVERRDRQPVVAEGGGEEADLGSAPGDPGQVDRVLGQGVKLESGAAPGLDATRGGQDRGSVCGHPADVS